jgi:hypothetical protein
MQSVRDVLRARGVASTKFQHDLANAYMNRGHAKEHAFGPADATPDYNEAIKLMEWVRDVLRDERRDWPPLFQSDLANAYNNRGNGKEDATGPGEGLPDYEEAIKLAEALRDTLQKKGLNWPPQFQNNLANYYANHGDAIRKIIGPPRAIPDYNKAIELREQLRDSLQQERIAWPPQFQVGLAGDYSRRALANWKTFGVAQAIPDLDKEIEIMRSLHDAQCQSKHDWPPEFERKLANAYITRAFAKQPRTGPAEAIPDYDAAIISMKDLRDALRKQGLAWPPQYQNDLAWAYMNRGKAKAIAIGPAAATADVKQAATIQEELVRTLGRNCPPPYQQQLDAIHELQRMLT